MDGLRALWASAVVLALAGCSHGMWEGSGRDGWAHGPGMMGGGWGPGPGMMGGGYGYGPGAMWGDDMGWALQRLDLTPDQRRRIAEIHDDLMRRQQAAMQSMHDQAMPPQRWDDATQRRHYDQMMAVHRQMFELHQEARRRMLDVLTPEQREQLSRGGPRR